jgi:long-chain acyl-CoA synthetase
LVKAVIVPKDGMSVKDVVDFCDGKIADYKIPRIIEFKSKIPKSPTGKVLIEHL